MKNLFIIVLLISALVFFIIHSALQTISSPPGSIFMIIGALFAVIGNYFPSLKPNYFIGIRTPWTLESEKVWKETHKMAGKLWLPGGILIALAGLILDFKIYSIFFTAGVALLALIPVIFSYKCYRSAQKPE